MNNFRVSNMCALAVTFFLCGCAAHTNLIPLEKGQIAPNLSIGGPIVEAFGTHIPVPYLMAGADYGLSDEVSANASVHLLPLAYNIAGVDFSTTWFPLKNNGWQPSVGIGPRFSAFISTKKDMENRFFVYPGAFGSAAWEIGPGLFYTGIDINYLLVRPHYDDEAEILIFSPFTGYSWNIGNRYSLLTELKLQGANIQTNQIATSYTALGNYGAVTPLITLQRKF